jgi:hypothetical protein
MLVLIFVLSVWLLPCQCGLKRPSVSKLGIVLVGGIGETYQVLTVFPLVLINYDLLVGTWLSSAGAYGVGRCHGSQVFITDPALGA